MDLRRAELNAWLDVRCLGAGSNWKHEIQRAIKSARFFLLLISKHSVGKRGFVQREIKQALAVLQEFPAGAVFMIPARLDETVPVDLELHDLNWVSLLPDYHAGFARILSAFIDLKKLPLKFSGSAAPTVPITIVDKGKQIAVDLPLLIGDRAPVSYAPFRTAREFLQQFFDRLPPERQFADTALSYYVTFSTKHSRVALSDDLRAKFPDEITIVLQNVFRELTVRSEGVSVVLSFGGKTQAIAIPYEAIRGIYMPEIGVQIAMNQGPAA